MRQNPKHYELYKHFKGDTYQVLTLAKHSESGETMVVYQGLYGECPVYVRPLEMFLEKVDKVKYPEAKQEYRFERVTAVSTFQADACDKSPSAGQSAEAESVTADMSEMTEAEMQIHPMVLAFLDATTYERRLEILSGLQHSITDDMLTTMAVACDVELPDGDLEERYRGLRNCLITLEKYECNRLR